MIESSSKVTRAASRRSWLALVGGFCLVLATASRALALPTLDVLMADFGFSPSDVERVRKGELVNTTTKETSDREIAAVMVFLVKAPAKTLVPFFQAGKAFRNDPQVQSVSEIGGEGTIEEFKGVVLKPDGANETKRYLEAEPGNTLNLSSSEIAAFQKLAASDAAGQAQVEAEIRRQLLARYQDYRSKGLAGIAPYARGTKEETKAGEELRRATEAAAMLKKYAPAFYEVLSKYPQGAAPPVEQQFFCIRYTMSDRPTLTLRQRMTMPIDDGYVVSDREFYVSHDYNETQALGGLLPVEGGTAVVYLNRTTTDQLGGFGASTKQAIGRRMMASQIREIFEKTRAGFK